MGTPRGTANFPRSHPHPRQKQTTTRHAGRKQRDTVTRKTKRPLSEERRVQRALHTPPNAPPPTDGITSSAESLSTELGVLHNATLAYMETGARRIGEKFHLRTSDVMNFLWAKIRVQR